MECCTTQPKPMVDRVSDYTSVPSDFKHPHPVFIFRLSTINRLNKPEIGGLGRITSYPFSRPTVVRGVQTENLSVANGPMRTQTTRRTTMRDSQETVLDTQPKTRTSRVMHHLSGRPT